ncbi:ScbR family autoregulator-binding transcription factor [Streptomyces sp. NPDC060035]|uniref:ScbR family autoregulator-binding transcription factor n=1 Tax=Streptomyces sp. NPDC060035 TaxID=3347044 RepID=UPI00367ABF5C
MAMQDRAVRTRQELIRSAAEAFDRSGFAPSSLTEISVGAGVSSGALHFHFGSKRALGAAVESAAAQILQDIIAPRPCEQPESLRNLVDTSHVLARRLAEDVVLRAGFGLASDAAWQENVELWRVWRAWVRSVLTLARGEGALVADVLIEDLVSAVTVAVVGAQALGRADADWSPRHAVAQFWNLLLPRITTAVVRPG